MCDSSISWICGQTEPRRLGSLVEDRVEVRVVVGSYCRDLGVGLRRGDVLEHARDLVATFDDGPSWARRRALALGGGLEERIGKAFVRNLLDGIAKQAAAGAVPGATAGTMDQASQAVELVGRLRNMDRDDDGRRNGGRAAAIPIVLRKIMRRLEDRDSPRRGRGDDGGTKAMGDFMGRMLDLVDKMDERQAKRMDELRREMREQREDHPKQDDFWGEQAKAALMSKLQANPLQEYAQMREHFRSELGADGGNADADLFLARERVAIERLRATAEISREDRALEQRQGFIDNVLPVLGKRKGDRADQAPVYQLVCGACQHKWLVDTNPATMETVVCPSCKQETMVPPSPTGGA